LRQRAVQRGVAAHIATEHVRVLYLVATHIRPAYRLGLWRKAALQASRSNFTDGVVFRR
jgi:hypothetical protein